jgi:hypothetical protein
MHESFNLQERKHIFDLTRESDRATDVMKVFPGHGTGAMSRMSRNDIDMADGRPVLSTRRLFSFVHEQ